MHTERQDSAASVIATGIDIDTLGVHRTPTPHVDGGVFTPPPLPKGAKRDGFVPDPPLRAGDVPTDTELSDGNVYRLASDVYDTNPFSVAGEKPIFGAGQSVQICKVQSKLSGRIYYRIDNKPVYRLL